MIKQAIFAVILGFLSLSSYADQSSDSFQSVCVDSWLKKMDSSVDKVDYKDFGEKYCTCAAGQPLNNDADIQKAIQLCMSRTLLHDAMDSVEEEIGLKEAKDTDVLQYCEGRWSLVYPKQNEVDKKITTGYCQCAQPKLIDVIKQSDNMTDKQYDDAINEVAATCSGMVKQESPQTPAS